MRIHRHRIRQPKIPLPLYKVNRQIKAEELRVINEKGEILGVLSLEEAIRLAGEKELDLVEVSPKANPPVARLLEYSQFKYQKEKEIHKQRAQSKQVDLKGIRLSVRISEHDMEVRLKQAKKFLERGDKVRVEIVLRGREKSHPELAKEMIEKFLADLGGFYPLRLEQEVKKQANRVTAIAALS